MGSLYLEGISVLSVLSPLPLLLPQLAVFLLPLQPSDVILKGDKLVFLVHYFVWKVEMGKYKGGVRKRRRKRRKRRKKGEHD